MGRRIRPEDLWQLRIPTGLAIAPDGGAMAFSVAEPDPDGGTWREHVFLSPLVGGDSRALPVTRAAAKNVEPRWWPDGRWLAFRSDRADARFQVFRVPVQMGEAEPLTHVEGEVQGYQIGPEGSALLLRVKEPESKQDKKRREQHRDVRVAETDFRFSHLWWLDLGSGRLRRLTRGRFDVSAATLSPDGRWVAFTWSDDPGLDSRTFRTQLAVLDVRTGRRRRLAAEVKRVSVLYAPQFSPDGRMIVFGGYPRDDTPLHPLAYAVGRGGGRARLLAPQVDRPQMVAKFAADGRSVVMVVAEGSTWRMVRCRLADGRCEDVGPRRGVVSDVAVAPRGGRMAFACARSDQPPGLFVSRLDGRGLRRMGLVNGHFAEVRMSEARTIRYRNDGWGVEALLRVPRGRGPHPMIVHPHGGPQSASLDEFAPHLQLFVEAGYAVLQPNFRGSVGYGSAFVARILNDWGDGPMRDILAGVDWCVEHGIADPKRLGLYGSSYGGYITGWIVGHTGRFRAAVAQCAVIDQLSMYGTTDIPTFMRMNLGGSPVQQQQRYWEQSPLAAVGNVRTPVLIITGESDERVHPTQSWELFRHLRAAGVRTELVIYPREPHAVGEPHHRLDNLRRVLAWFDRYLRPGR